MAPTFGKMWSALLLSVLVHCVLGAHPVEMLPDRLRGGKLYESEVRFRDAAMIRGLIIGTLQHAIHAGARQTATVLTGATLNAVRPVYSGTAPAYGGPYNQGLAEQVYNAYAPQQSLTPIAPTHYVVVSLLLANAATVILLIAIIVREVWQVVHARRTGRN